MTLFKACLLSCISTDKPYKVTIDDVDILLAKTLDDKIWAFDAMCSHADKSMENGRWDPANGHITCPFHKAVFDVPKGGAHLKPPAFSPIKTYAVVVKNEDSGNFVFIEMD